MALSPEPVHSEVLGLELQHTYLGEYNTALSTDHLYSLGYFAINLLKLITNIIEYKGKFTFLYVYLCCFMYQLT